MEKKIVKDTTKEDHYVEIAIGFKIIYNQNQYLAYTEVPKKKKDVRLEIYIGRVSLLKEQYLLFKCETDSERRQVFSYFKQVFSGEVNNEIEPVDFSIIERMSIVSSDLFEEKMDQYPNFFTLPKKEEIDANITLPNFLMKKTSKIKAQPEEIQFVKNSDTVLESNVEPSNKVENIVEEANPVSTPEIAIVPNQNIVSEQTVPVMPSVQAGSFNESMSNIPPVQEVNTINIIPTGVEPNRPLEKEDISKELPTLERTEQQAEAAVVETPIPITEVVTPINHMNVVGVPPIEPTLTPEVPVEEPVKFEQIYDGKKRKKEKKKGKNSIVILMIITLLLIASIAVVYVFVLEPQMQETNKPNTPITKPEEPKTSNLVCTIETENTEDNSLENKTITFVYDNASKNILSSKEHITVTMSDADIYMERKAMIKVFSQELNNTDGQKYTFKYDDKQYIYQVFIDRDYEKATETEKDETWKNTFDEANEYYLKEGYTCNGIKKEPSNELTLTSTTGNNTVDYNNWVVTYQKAILSEDKETLSITLEVKNNGTEARTLNGILKLFDKNNQNVRNTKMNQQIAPGETSTIVIDIKSTNENKDPELGNLEIVNFEDISQYLIELYR
ncbi:MAG: hypothetical protein HFH08_00410 [Bacilli bacterium]|nr:hypothetical protein [Bacilli bacterium]